MREEGRKRSGAGGFYPCGDCSEGVLAGEALFGLAHEAEVGALDYDDFGLGPRVVLGG